MDQVTQLLYTANNTSIVISVTLNQARCENCADRPHGRNRAKEPTPHPIPGGKRHRTSTMWDIHRHPVYKKKGRTRAGFAYLPLERYPLGHVPNACPPYLMLERYTRYQTLGRPSSLLPACLSRILLETPNNPGPLPFPTRPDERPRCNNAPTLWWKSQQPRSPHCPDGSRCKCLIPQLPRLLLKPPTTPAPVQSTGNGRSSIKSSENREENPPSSTPAKNIRIYHLMIR